MRRPGWSISKRKHFGPRGENQVYIEGYSWSLPRPTFYFGFVNCSITMAAGFGNNNSDPVIECGITFEIPVRAANWLNKVLPDGEGWRL